MVKTSIDFNGDPIATEAGQSENVETNEVKEVEEVETPVESVEPVEKENEVETVEPVEPETLEKPTEETEETETLPDWAKAKIEKLENDKENYKKGLLKYKKFSLTPEKEEKKVEEEYPEWDDASKKFQKQTLSEAEKRAEARAMAVIEKANEKSAIASFLSNHPDVKNQWDDIVANYTPKNGKETQADIMKDLERALVLTQYEKGTLNKSDKKGEKAVANLNTVSKTTSKNAPEGAALTKGALEFARKLGVDPKELSNESTIKF
jgi:hypothetical protein